MIPTPKDQNNRRHRHAVGNGDGRPAVRLIRSFEHKTGVVIAEKSSTPVGADRRRSLMPIESAADSQSCHQPTQHYPHSTQKHPA